MSRAVEWDGQPFALLIGEPGAGGYLGGPIVLDSSGAPVGEGNREVLLAIADSGIDVKLPVAYISGPGELAEIDRRLAALCSELGVTLGPQRGSDG